MIENHAHELQIIAHGAVKAAATHLELRVLGNFKIDGNKCPVFDTLMHSRQSLSHGWCDVEAGVVHLLPKMWHHTPTKIFHHLNIGNAEDEVRDTDGAELLQFADDLGAVARDKVFV